MPFTARPVSSNLSSDLSANRGECGDVVTCGDLKRTEYIFLYKLFCSL